MDDTPEYTDDYVRQLLKEALAKKLESNKFPTEVATRKALLSTIQEFMSCFKLVGYDLEGRLVSVTYTSKDIHKHALIHAFIEEFGKTMESKSI